MISVPDLTFEGSSATAQVPFSRVLSGELPTGRLHLGHWLGTLRARVALQRAGFETFVVIADLQVDPARVSPQDLPRHVSGLVLDYLACGLDPERTAVFAHSQVPALHQLFVSLLGLADITELPTHRSRSGLVLTSQVHQAADILAVGATHVPVGLDNQPHVHFAATLASRFNDRYGETLVVPTAVLTSTPVVLGLNGRKMSKSGANAIALSATEDETVDTIMRSTAPDGVLSSDDLQSPPVVALITLAAQCLGKDPAQRLDQFRHRTGRDLKRETADIVNATLAEHRARRRDLEAEPDIIAATLLQGAAVANGASQATLRNVLEATGASYSAVIAHSSGWIER